MSYKASLYSRCRRKVRYAKRPEAQEVVRQLEAAHGHPGVFRAYSCLCGGWHVGAVRCAARDRAVRHQAIVLFPVGVQNTPEEVP